MDLINTCFSFKGRLNRRAFWAAITVLATVQLVISHLPLTLFPDAPYTISKDNQITWELHGPMAWAAGIFMFFAFWVMLATMLKRVHDRDHSGWFLLLFLVPFLNLWLLIELYFLRGTEEDNRYGPDPLAGRPTESWKSWLLLLGIIVVFLGFAGMAARINLIIREHPPHIEGQPSNADLKPI